MAFQDQLANGFCGQGFLSAEMGLLPAEVELRVRHLQSESGGPIETDGGNVISDQPIGTRAILGQRLLQLPTPGGLRTGNGPAESNMVSNTRGNPAGFVDYPYGPVFGV